MDRYGNNYLGKVSLKHDFNVAQKKNYLSLIFLSNRKNWDFAPTNFWLHEVTAFHEKIIYQKAEDCKRIYYVKSETQTGLDTHSELLFQRES